MKQDLKLCLDVVLEARIGMTAELARHPEYADLRHLLALLEMSVGNLPAAETAVSLALEVNPRFPAARSTLAHLHLLAGRLSRAAEIFRALDTDDPTGTRGQYGQALVALADGRAEEAISRLEACIEMTGRRLPWLHRLGVAHLSAGNIPAAVTLWREAASDPIAGPLYAEVGWTGLGTPGDTLLQTVAGLIPANTGLAPIEEHFGKLYARGRLWSEARQAYRRGYQLDGDLARYEARLGALASVQGRDIEAIAHYQKSVDANPNHVPARVALAFELSAQGDIERAIEQMEAAARLRPGWPDIQYNLGLHYTDTGRFSEARTCFLNALRVNPAYAQAQLGLAFSWFKSGEFPMARVEFEKVLALGLESSDILLHLALCHLETGEVERSLEVLAEAQAVNPDDPRIYLHLGRIHQTRGSRRKAFAAFQRFTELSPGGTLPAEFESELRDGTGH